MPTRTLLPLLATLLATLPAARAANIRVDDAPPDTGQESPYLAVDSGGGLHVVWGDARDGGKDVRHARSNDGGATWSASVRVNDVQGHLVAGYQNGPQLRALGPDTLVVVWSDSRYGYFDTDVFAAHSTDGGATWAPSVRVNDDPEGSFNFLPSLAATADGTLATAWLDERGEGSQIYCARSTDLGQTWSANVAAVVQPQGEPCDCCLPHLVAGPQGSLLLAFRNNIDDVRDAHLARSTDSGSSWLAPVRVADSAWNINACPTSGPALAISGGQLVMAWMDAASGHRVIFSDRSSDYGTSFGADVVVRDPGLSIDVDRPVIAAVDGPDSLLYVAYRSTDRDAADVLLARSTDRGASWILLGYLAESPPGVREDEVELVVDAAGTPLAVWTDRRDDIRGDIYFGAGVAVDIAEGTGRGTPPAAHAELLAPRPNPFNPRTKIGLRAARDGHLELAIFDLAGRRVRLLHRGHLPAGDHLFAWDGRDQHGVGRTSGLYLAIAELDGKRLPARRLLLLK